jgi:ArsR family transcriptional regulator, arsenate/arsenite/antimonite-responsive transcriptional repressor
MNIHSNAYAEGRIGRLMDNALNILSALAEPTRLAAIRLLWDGREHCVCELMERLGATQSRMSRHMATLKAAGLVTDRRDAQWVRYRRAPDIPATVAALIDAALALPAQPERIAA